jgi:adenylosuccinate lyase
VLPDSSAALDYMLDKTASLLDGLVVYPEHMLENLNLTRGLVFSGQLLLALTQSGVTREAAYEWVQRNAMKVWDEGGDFQTLVNADPDIQKHLSSEQIKNAFSLDTYLRNVDAVFERVFNQEDGKADNGSLKAVMDEMSEKAQSRGLRPEILESALEEE